MRKFIPLIITGVLMLLFFIITPPTGEMIVSLPWQTFFTLFMLSVAAGGLGKERIYAPVGVLMSSFQYTYSLIAFSAAAAFIISPFITAPYAVLAIIPLLLETLEKAGKKELRPVSAAIVSVAASCGAMLFPEGSAQNLILMEEHADLSVITVMYPAVIIAVPVLALIIALVMRFKVRDRIYIHESSDPEPGNKSLRMLYICLAIVAGLSAFRLFFWFDVLIVFLAVIIIFDRKVLLKTDYILLVSFLFLVTAVRSAGSDENVTTLLSGLTAAHPLLFPLLLSAVLGPVPAAVLLSTAAENTELLLIAVNLGGMMFLSSVSAFNAIRAEGNRRTAAWRIVTGTAAVILIILLLFFCKALPV